jgi:hypothetical protein
MTKHDQLCMEQSMLSGTWSGNKDAAFPHEATGLQGEIRQTWQMPVQKSTTAVGVTVGVVIVGARRRLCERPLYRSPFGSSSTVCTNELGPSGFIAPRFVRTWPAVKVKTPSAAIDLHEGVTATAGHTVVLYLLDRGTVLCRYRGYHCRHLSVD